MLAAEQLDVEFYELTPHPPAKLFHVRTAYRN
jgi:hypothetical protein